MRILLVSDSVSLNTGYANTLKEIVDALLEDHHEIRQIAWGLKENKFDKIYQYAPPSGDFFGKTLFPKVIEDFIPHIVLSFGDIHNVSWIGNFPNKFYKWLAYFPLDSEYITTAQSFIVKSMDVPIVYSKTALNLVLSATHREDIKVIYHGVDTNVFKPLDKLSIKKKYGLQDKFVVGAVGRNNARKNYPALIESFAKFAEGKDDVILYLHTSPIDVGHNLYEYIKRYNLSNKVYITKDMDGTMGVDRNQLVEIYSLFDLCVSTTAGEGLGLNVLESQACETPILITDYSACKEFVPKDLRIKVKAHYFDAFWDTERAIIDQDDLVSKLNKFYNNRNLLPILGKSGRQFVEGWDWKYIKPLWKYFIKLYGEQALGIKEDNNAMAKFIKI